MLILGAHSFPSFWLNGIFVLSNSPQAGGYGASESQPKVCAHLAGEILLEGSFPDLLSKVPKTTSQDPGTPDPLCVVSGKKTKNYNR